MKNLFDYEKTQSATADLPFGAFKDESAPGQQNGTDIVAAHIQDIAYPLYQVLQLAGVTPNGELEDGNNKTQFIQALTNIGICRHSDKVVYNKSVFVWTILGNDFVLYRSIKDENSAELNDASSWQKILEIGSDNVLKFAVDTNIEIENSVESYLTNCILEIPQNIKYTLEDGTLTIKAGTIVTVPYGTTDQSSTYPVGATFLNNNFKVVKTYFTNNKFFVQAEVQADLSVSSSAADSNRLVGLAPQSNGTYNFTDTACYSGATAPTATATLAIWYDTTNNVIKQTDNSGESWDESYWCLPLLLAERANQEWTNVLNVFNGMGYIGKTVFVNPDVKVLITTAVNDDGSKVNTEYTTDSVYLATSSASNIEFVIAITPNSFNTGKFAYLVTYSSYSISPVPPETARWLNSQNGLFYLLKNGVWRLDPQVHLGFGTLSDGVITDFQPFGTVSVADDQTVMHKWGDETIYGNKTFNQPIVSTANGVLSTGNFIVKTADGIGTDAVIAINSDTGIRCGSLRFQNGDGYNHAMLIAAAEDGTSNSIILYNSNTTAYATCPTYTANYADSSVKIVTTQFLTNRWTTSRATTTSSASKARPAVVIQNYVNGTSWYRVWSDGWIEQGGRAQVVVSAASVYPGTENVTVINLLKAFSNANYFTSFTFERYSSADQGRTDDTTALINAIATNSVTVFCFDGGGNKYNTYLRWSACGY